MLHRRSSCAVNPVAGTQTQVTLHTALCALSPYVLTAELAGQMRYTPHSNAHAAKARSRWCRLASARSYTVFFMSPRPINCRLLFVVACSIDTEASSYRQCGATAARQTLK